MSKEKKEICIDIRKLIKGTQHLLEIMYETSSKDDGPMPEHIIECFGNLEEIDSHVIHLEDDAHYFTVVCIFSIENKLQLLHLKDPWSNWRLLLIFD